MTKIRVRFAPNLKPDTGFSFLFLGPWAEETQFSIEEQVLATKLGQILSRNLICFRRRRTWKMKHGAGVSVLPAHYLLIY